MSDDDTRWYLRPVFSVTDCAASLAFYEKLGFHVAWKYEEDATIVAVQVDRDGSEIILNLNPARAGGGRVFLSLNRGQVARCCESFMAAGVDVGDGHWGMPVRVVKDLDGNDLLFYDDEMKSS
jgi:catechol 2,3-dioxygenase-like lactoylglutathione lyase family enzyme